MRLRPSQPTTCAHATLEMTAALFTLRRLRSDAIVGAALVCPEARVLLGAGARRGASQSAVRDAPPSGRRSQAEVANLTSGPLPTSSSDPARPGRQSRVSRSAYLVTEDLAEAAPAEVAAVLDARLRAQPLDEPGLR